MIMVVVVDVANQGDNASFQKLTAVPVGCDFGYGCRVENSDSLVRITGEKKKETKISKHRNLQKRCVIVVLIPLMFSNLTHMQQCSQLITWSLKRYPYMPILA